MTFQEITRRIGKNLKYYDDTDGWLTTRDVTQTDIEDFANEVYTEEMFPLFASRWPHLFRTTATIDSWLISATVNSSSTGSTLVIDTDDNTEFANSMIGLTVYNETDDETRVIEDWTSTSTVTVDEAIDDDWDGDTIYVLGQEFAYGGDASDFHTLEQVSVKQESDWDYYRRCEVISKEEATKIGTDIYVDRTEIGSKAAPWAYPTTILDSSNMYVAIGIYPGFDEKVEEAIMIDYIAKPAAITGAGTTPIIPVQASMIAGGTMKAFQKMKDWEAAKHWEGKYLIAEKKDISRFRPTTTSDPRRIKVHRNAFYQHKRLI